MESMTTIRRFIKTARRAGRSDNSVAKELGINIAEIGRLLHGHYPGEKVAARLGLPVKCARCHRKVASPYKTMPKSVPVYMKQWRSLSKDEREQIIRVVMEGTHGKAP
jgi:hypothetical protein